MKFAQIAGLWTLAHHPTRESEWSIDRKLRAIKAAGFVGVCAPLDAAIASLAHQHGLLVISVIFPESAEDASRLLLVQKEFGAKQVNVQLGTHTTTPADAVRSWIKLENEAEKLGIELSLETHRDSATETPEKVEEMAARYEKSTGRRLRLTWDFSHLGVVKHLHTGQYVERLLMRPELIQHASQLHFRPFNRHHAQLPVTHKGKLTPETRDYLSFVTDVLRVWKSAPQNKERTLLACPLLGPKGSYALSNFPPVWSDALVLSEELGKCWSGAK